MEFAFRDILLPALEQAADAVVLIDHTETVRFFNGAAERLWGFGRDEVLGQPVSMLVPAAVRSRHHGYLQAGRNGRLPGPGSEVKIERKDGSELHGSISLSTFEADGKLHYIGLVRDITDKVVQREQLRLLSLAVDHTDRTIVILDGARRITYVNRAFTELFGLSPDDVAGKCLANVLSCGAADGQALERIRARSWETQGFTEELTASNRLGEPVWLSLAVNPILDAGGDVANVVVVVTDVTPLRRIQSLQEDVLSALADGSDLQQVAELLCRRIEAIAPEVISSLLLVDDQQRLRPLAGPQLTAEYSAAVDGIPIGENVGSCGTAAFRGEPVTVTDIASDPLWEGVRELALPLGLRACWSSPIKLGDGRVAGTFAFYFREPREPGPFHEKIVEASLHLCRLAIEHDEARRRIAQLSLFDPLTGLPNRAHLLAEGADILSRAGTSESSVAVFALNLDRFRLRTH